MKALRCISSLPSDKVFCVGGRGGFQLVKYFIFIWVKNFDVKRRTVFTTSPSFSLLTVDMPPVFGFGENLFQLSGLVTQPPCWDA